MGSQRSPRHLRLSTGITFVPLSLSIVVLASSRFPLSFFLFRFLVLVFSFAHSFFPISFSLSLPLFRSIFLFRSFFFVLFFSLFVIPLLVKLVFFYVSFMYHSYINFTVIQNQTSLLVINSNWGICRKKNL